MRSKIRFPDAGKDERSAYRDEWVLGGSEKLWWESHEFGRIYRNFRQCTWNTPVNTPRDAVYKLLMLIYCISLEHLFYTVTTNTPQTILSSNLVNSLLGSDVNFGSFFLNLNSCVTSNKLIYIILSGRRSWSPEDES